MNSRTRSRRRAASFLTALATFALVACESGDTEATSPALTATSPSVGTETATAAPTEVTPAAVGLNEADVTFLQMMIPHHEQAVEMASLVEGRTDRPELVEPADAIIATQNAEVEEMNGLLAAADAEPAGGMDQMPSMSMPGMMDQSEMDEMTALEGDAFVAAFLEAMTTHHQGAIEMAETVLDEGTNAEVLELARDVIAAQQTEIDQMAAWKQEWGLS